MLRDRDVLADHETVPIEAEDGFLVGLGHTVVEECPLAAAVVHEMTVLVVLSRPQATHPAGGPLVVPAVAIELTVSGQRATNS